IVAARFGVTKQGKFEKGQAGLSVVSGTADIAAEVGIPGGRGGKMVAGGRRKVDGAGAGRGGAVTDEEVVTDWTSLAISAFALAGRLLDEPRYGEAARRAADRILASCRTAGDLLHREKDGVAEISGFASDYAFFVEALLDLYEATFEPRYFRAAIELQREMDERFSDPRGGYFLAAEKHDRLIVRPREIFDGATPSSNS